MPAVTSTLCPGSVIIPAYNSERWLRRAVESALGVTRTVDEIVVIDDGSTDQTLRVAYELAKEHSCVTVATQKVSGGAAAARAQAAQLARNDWIALLDSDDYLSPDAVAGAYDHAISQRADVCVWAVSRDSDGRVHTFLPVDQIQFPLTGREAARLTLGDWKLPAVGVIRRKLFVEASERVGIQSFDADELVSRELMIAASRVVAGPGTYFYVDNVESTTRSATTDRSGAAASHLRLLSFAAGNSFLKTEPRLAAELVRHGLKIIRGILEGDDPAWSVPRRRVEIIELVTEMQLLAPRSWRCGPREMYRSLRGRSVRQAVRMTRVQTIEHLSFYAVRDSTRARFR